MPQLAKTDLNPGNWHINLNIVNGGWLRLWKDASSKNPTFAFWFDPNGQLVQYMYDSSGKELESNVVGYYTPLVKDASTMFQADGCGTAISFYTMDQAIMIGSYSNADTLQMTMVDGSDGGNPQYSITGTVSPQAELCGLRQAESSGSSAPGNPLPWWIWLMVGVAAILVILVIIFASLAAASAGKSTTVTTTETREVYV